MNKEILGRFVIGSSVIAGAVSFGYIGNGMRNWRKSGRWSPNQFNEFEWTLAFVLVLLGVFNAVSSQIEVEQVTERVKMGITGALYGLTLSTIGRQFGFPVKVFGFKSKNQYMIHVAAAVLYAMIFAFIIHPLNVELGI